MSEVPPTPSSSEPPDAAADRARAAQRLRDGQAHELAFRLDDAIAAYVEAVALLSRLADGANSAAVRELAIAWMNLANARAKHGTLSDAIDAYDEALRLLAELPTNDVPTLASRGAAWLNRAAVLQRIGSPDALDEASRSSDQALVWLARLPLTVGATPAHRINLAGAWLNRTELNLQRQQPPAAVREAARYALEFAHPSVLEEPSAAAVALRARIVLLTVIAAEVVDAATHDRAVAEAGDVIDEGLALVRHWQPRRLAPLAELGLQLFHRGAHLYATHQPHFLVEFLRETFSPGPAGINDPWREGLRSIALESLEAAEQRLHASWLTPDRARPLNDILATLAEVRAHRAAWSSQESAR